MKAIIANPPWMYKEDRVVPPPIFHMHVQDKSAEKKFFDSREEWNVFSEWRYSSLVDYWLKESGIRSGELLDLGCGSGIFGHYFKKKGFRVVGLDVSSSLVKVAAKRLDSAVVGDAENTPFEESRFDGVIAGGLLHHFPSKQNLVKEMNRVLKRKGFLFTQDPNMLNPKIMVSQAAFSPFRSGVTENECPITPEELVRSINPFFQTVSLKFFSFIPPQMRLSDRAASAYLKIESLLQRTPLKYLGADLVSVSSKR